MLSPELSMEEGVQEVKTYPTKTQATKAKKFGQTVRKRRDGTWVCEKPKVKVGKGRTTLNIQAMDIESVST